jgi:hypothetical protein
VRVSRATPCRSTYLRHPRHSMDLSSSDQPDPHPCPFAGGMAGSSAGPLVFALRTCDSGRYADPSTSVQPLGSRLQMFKAIPYGRPVRLNWTQFLATLDTGPVLLVFTSGRERSKGASLRLSTFSRRGGPMGGFWLPAHTYRTSHFCGETSSQLRQEAPIAALALPFHEQLSGA